MTTSIVAFSPTQWTSEMDAVGSALIHSWEALRIVRPHDVSNNDATVFSASGMTTMTAAIPTMA
ncbi:hypothetical protein [Microbacterium schleiferi]|uniref:hypothetical protein n=1 Tax=Microbacterium schleiferi TaxID=69362 RepID=UPI00311EFF3A